MRGDPNDTLIPQSRDGFEGMTYREAAHRFWDMCRRVRDAANVDIAYSTTSVLADLIDPTCHIAPDDWASQQCMGPMLSCDRCQAAFPEINSPYVYCPNCGARVVEG